MALNVRFDHAALSVSNLEKSTAFYVDLLGFEKSEIIECPPESGLGNIVGLPGQTLESVAAGHFPFLPVRLMLRDRWDNGAALQPYAGFGPDPPRFCLHGHPRGLPAPPATGREVLQAAH